MKTISHTRWECKYHLVWITYRKPVLTGEVAVWLRELVREICKAKDAELIKGYISLNHIRIFVSAPPHISVSDLLKALKGLTSWRMLMDFKSLNRQLWGRHFWARGYFAASSGNVSDEVVMKYIEQQGHEPPDGGYKTDGDPYSLVGFKPIQKLPALVGACFTFLPGAHPNQRVLNRFYPENISNETPSPRLGGTDSDTHHI